MNKIKLNVRLSINLSREVFSLKKPLIHAAARIPLTTYLNKKLSPASYFNKWHFLIENEKLYLNI